MFWRTSAPFGFPPPSSSLSIERLFARYRVPYTSPSPTPGEGEGAEGNGAGEVIDGGELGRLALLDALLDSEDADVLNECKSRSRPLLSLLSHPSILARLLFYATGTAFSTPPISYTPVKPATGEGEETGEGDDEDEDLEAVRERIRREERGETVVEGEVGNEEKGWDVRRRQKFPTIATELIALEDPLLLDALATSPALLPFWNWISTFRPVLLQSPPTSEGKTEEEKDKEKEEWEGRVKEEGLWVSYWARIAGVLVGGRRGAEFLNLILPTLPTLIPSLIPLVPLFPPLSDLLTRLLASFPPSSPPHASLLLSLREAGFVDALIEMMDPRKGGESHSAAGQLVLDMIGVAYGPGEGEEGGVFGGGGLMKELKAEGAIAKLVGYMLPPSTEPKEEIPIASYSSSLTNGINILIELIRRYSSDIEAAEVAHQQAHVAASMGEPGPGVGEQQLRELATDLDGLLRVVSRHVGEWAGVLEWGMRVPLPKAGEGVGVELKGARLGAERLRVCELFAEVLHLQYLYASSPLFEVLVEGSVFLDEDEELVSKAAEVSLEDKGLARSESTTSVIQELHSLSRSIAKHGILPRCMALFFLYPWNNFLHSVVYDMVAKVFNTFAYVAGVVGGTLGHEAEGVRNEAVEGRMRRMRDGVGELVVSIVKDGQLMEKIVEAQGTNDALVSQPRGSRLGYMGHLTHVADECLKLWEKCSSDLPLSLHTSFLSPAWIEYANGTLRETRERDRQPLGGARPNAMAIGLGMQEDEGRNNGVTVAFGNATLDPGSDGDLRGWTGPGSGGVVGLGNLAEDDDEEDGNASKFAAYLSQKAGNLPGRIAGANDSDDEERDTDSEGEEGDLHAARAPKPGEGDGQGVASGIQGWFPEQSTASPPRTDVRRSSSHGLDDEEEPEPAPLSIRVSDDVELFHDAVSGPTPNASGAEDFFANFDTPGAATPTQVADPLAPITTTLNVEAADPSSDSPPESWADFKDAPPG